VKTRWRVGRARRSAPNAPNAAAWSGGVGTVRLPSRLKRRPPSFAKAPAGAAARIALPAGGRDVTCPFAALGSLGSVIEVAGAKIGISESSAVSGYASGMVKGGYSDWEDTHLSVPFDSYEGTRFATLPVLTVRLDPEAGVLDRTIRPPLEFLRLSCALNLISIHS